MAGFADATKYGIETDSGVPKGTRHEIACMTWFTSTGKTMPRYFKFEDDSGAIQTVTDIVVNYTEEKNYSGIPSREYGCKAIIGGLNLSLIHIWQQLRYANGSSSGSFTSGK